MYNYSYPYAEATGAGGEDNSKLQDPLDPNTDTTKR